MADERVLRLHQQALTPLSELIPPGHLFPLQATESHKSPDTVIRLAGQLLAMQATRHTLLIALGGGVITDTTAFLASVYKRGVDVALVPTTLLAMADAAVGGKTAVNLEGVKNVLGTFYPPRAVFCATPFLETLPPREWCNGLGELAKYALLQGGAAWTRLTALESPVELQAQAAGLILSALQLKGAVVRQDPTDLGLRHILNLGHTFGHALEALFQDPEEHGEDHFTLKHGEAVAAGLVCALYCSSQLLGFPPRELRYYLSFYRAFYRSVPIDCNSYPRLLELMHQDKKNSTPHGAIRMVGLTAPGNPVPLNITPEQAQAALDFLRESC